MDKLKGWSDALTWIVGLLEMIGIIVLGVVFKATGWNLVLVILSVILIFAIMAIRQAQIDDTSRDVPPYLIALLTLLLVSVPGGILSFVSIGNTKYEGSQKGTSSGKGTYTKHNFKVGDAVHFISNTYCVEASCYIFPNQTGTIKSVEQTGKCEVRFFVNNREVILKTNVNAISK